MIEYVIGAAIGAAISGPGLVKEIKKTAAEIREMQEENRRHKAEKDAACKGGNPRRCGE